MRHVAPSTSPAMPNELLIILGTLAASALSLGSLILRDKQRMREELGRSLPLARQLAYALDAPQPRLTWRYGHGAWEILAQQGDLAITLSLYRERMLSVEIQTQRMIAPAGATILALTDWRDMPCDLGPHAPLTPQTFPYHYIISPSGQEPSVSAALRDALMRWTHSPPTLTEHRLSASQRVEAVPDALAFITDCAALCGRA